jgi:hypothetical protein
MLLGPAKIVEDWSSKRWVKIAIATALALAHLLAFDIAAHTKLNIPFDLAPGAHLQFIDPMADSLSAQPRQPPKWSRLAVSRFDALSACPKDPKRANGRAYEACGLAWMPAYGVIGGIVARITHLEPDAALMWLSVLCAIVINLMWISRPMIERLGRLEAYTAMLAWNCYAAACYLVALETEPIVVALALAGFVMFMKERWVWSAVLIGACTAFRLQTASYAFALGCALLYATYQRRKAGVKQWWRPLIAIPLCGWGQFLEMAIFQIELGNFHAFFDARFAFGDHNNLARIIDIKWYLRGFGSQCEDMVVFLASIAVIALTGRRALARFKPAEAVWIAIASGATIFISVAGAGQYWGLARYMMLCPLPFLAAGMLVRQHRAFLFGWLLLNIAVYWNLELCSYITQGDPGPCPCLGRNELRMPWAS